MKSKFHLIEYFLSAILLALVLVFASIPQPALACEPTQVPPDYIPPTPIPLETQVASVIQDAQIVLDGTVTKWVATSDMNSILTVQVSQYLKGHGPKTVKLSGYFWICAPNFAFSEGSRAIFFVNGDPTSTEPLQVRTWFDSHATVATSVRNITRQAPMAPDGVYDGLWLGLVIMGILGFVALIRYRQARSSRELTN